MDRQPDVFISYASEDLEWVSENIYKPLLGCTFADGREPRIFFDQSDLGVEVGENIKDALNEAIRSSPKVIAVLSRSYFNKDWTVLELQEAIQDDLLVRKKKVIPLRKDLDPITDGGIAQKLRGVSVMNVTPSVDRSSWLPKLLRALSLQQGQRHRGLSFEGPIGDVLVNNTLPPVMVRVRGDRDPQIREELVVELTTSVEGLQGTLQRTVVDGVATFSDVSFRAPASAVVISAKAIGCVPACSTQFGVRAISVDPPPVLPPTQSAASIPCDHPEITQVFFFDSGKALAVVDPVAIRVYGMGGEKLAEMKGRSRVRVARTSGAFLSLVDWEGNLTLLRDDGSRQEVSLAPQGLPYATPGDCAIVDGVTIVGMWNGEVHRVDATGTRTLLFNHDGGIQCLAARGGQVFLCDFTGSFAVYEGGRQVYATPAERSVIGMALFPMAVVVIGEQKPYQFSFGDGRLIGWPSRHLSRCVDILPAASRILAVDDKGRGVFWDEQLTPLAQFHVTAGARPSCYGTVDGNSYVSFAYPDRTYALLKNEQIVYTNGSGLLSFDSKVTTIAVVTPRGGISLRNGTDWLDGLPEGN